MLASIAPSVAPQPAYAGPKVLPVLLVHGWGGWGNSKSEWIDGNWMFWNITEVDHGNDWAVYEDRSSPGIFDPDPVHSTPIYSLDYHGYKDAKGPLKQNAGILAKAIDVVTKDSGATDVYVIAHSQGGLMTRAVLMGLALDPDDGSAIDYGHNIFGFMTICTPHKGSSTNPLFQFDEAGKDMLDDSEFLKELNKVSTSMNEVAVCSVAVGNAQGKAHGDGLFSEDEQKPPHGTVPTSTRTSPFPVVHGPDQTKTNPLTGKAKYTTALASEKVQKWAVERYLEALTKYQEPSQATGTATSMALVIDVSGSMSSEYQGEIKLTQAQSAAVDVASIITGYGGLTKTGAEVSVSAFSNDAVTMESLTDDMDVIRQSVDALQTDDQTNVGAGIEDGIAQLDDAVAGSDRVMILLSDGQNNIGMTNDEVLAGPVTDAKRKHIKIFTVGYGEIGDLDPVFLQEIADATGGKYQLADATSLATSLAGTFALAQSAATQTTVLAQSEGTVAQDQTTQAGTFVVPNVSGDVQALLLWPGSKLRLDLTDPAGTKVGPGYPGYAQSTEPGPAQIVIQGAKSGTWTSSVYGEDVSMPEEPFYSIVSFKKVKRAAAVAGGGAGNNAGAGILIAVILMAAGAGVVWLVVAATRKREPEMAMVGGGLASGSMDGGPIRAHAFLVDDRGGRHPLRVGPNTVGRELGNDVLLDASSASRWHAVVTLTTSGLEVRDLDSSAGVFVNGQRVYAGTLQDGDELLLGDARLHARLETR